MVALAQKLVKDISEGQIIYLHCWGGHGRTGTVVCIMLYLLYGVSGNLCLVLVVLVLVVLVLVLVVVLVVVRVMCHGALVTVGVVNGWPSSCR